MSNELTTQRFPWEPAPIRATEEIVAALQRDFAYAVAHTAIVVQSGNPSMVFTANTQRGQIVPHGQVKFSDGTTVELQDIGMCQPNVPYMTVQEIMTHIWALASELGLELVK